MIQLCAFADEAAESLSGQIAALHRNGIRLIEARSIDGVNIADLSLDAARTAQRRFTDNGIAVWALGTPYGKCSLGESFREETLFRLLRRLCELARVFECGRLRIFSFYNAYGKKEQVLDLLSRSVRIATEYGVELYHENEKDIYGDVPDRVLDLTAADGLRFVYDPANYIQSGVPAEESLRKALPLASYCHIKDILSAGGEIVPAGEGDGRIPQLIRLLKDDTVLTVEPHLSVFSGLSDIQTRGLKTRYIFANNDESFDAAAAALKRLLTQAGYRLRDGDYIKETAGGPSADIRDPLS